MDHTPIPPLPDSDENQYASGPISGALTEPVKGGSGSSSFPFQVSLNNNPETGHVEASIGGGELIFIFQKTDVAITGLNEVVDDDVSIGDLIWLDILVSGLSGPTSAVIDSGDSSGWSGTSLNFPDPVDFDSDPADWDGTAPAPAQTHAYLLIAEIIDDGDGNPKVRQCVTTNLQMLPISYFGLTVYVPFAGFGST